MARKISQTALDYIKRWEGIRLKAYQDQAGNWTIGYGHTAAAGNLIPAAGMQITESQAHALLLSDLKQHEHAVETMVKVPLNDNKFATLVSFCFNVGTTKFKDSTLLKKLNSGDYDAIPVELMKWIYVTVDGKKVVSNGLVNRRASEAGLWAKGEFVSSGYVKPLPKKENALIKPETVGPFIGAAAGLTGFAAGNGPFQWALGVVMVIACLVGTWYFIRRVRRETA